MCYVAYKYNIVSFSLLVAPLLGWLVHRVSRKVTLYSYITVQSAVYCSGIIKWFQYLFSLVVCGSLTIWFNITAFYLLMGS